MITKRQFAIFWTSYNLHWIAAVILSGFIGAAIANGYATHEALQKQWGDCKWTIKQQLTAQRRRIEDQ